MTKEQYLSNLNDLDKDHNAKKLALIRAYLDANNPYKKGDVISNSHISIQIQHITYIIDSNNPSLYYTGIIVDKDGLSGIQEAHSIHQSDIINNIQNNDN